MRMQTHENLYSPPRIAGRSRRVFPVGVSCLLAWCRLAARHFACMAELRRGLARLVEMDDRMLRDIGLSRDDVYGLAGDRATPWSEYRWLPFGVCHWLRR